MTTGRSESMHPGLKKKFPGAVFHAARFTIFMLGLALSISPPPAAAQIAPPKMLVIDYAMSYPEENEGLMSIFTEAGFEVDYRQYYPSLVEQDALTYDAIVLMGGGDPGMSLQESDLAINFVLRGKLLILALPSDAEYSGKKSVETGVHARYMFNRVLNHLNIKLYAFAPPMENGTALTPVAAYEPVAGHRVNRGITGLLHFRAGTRIVVGAGAEPLLVEPEAEKAPQTAALTEEKPKPAPERKVRMVKRQIRVQATEVLPGEKVDLYLRGEQKLSGVLEYKIDRNSRPPITLKTDRVNGRIVRVTPDTLAVRISGNAWASDSALLQVPLSVATIAFVKREFPEELEGGDSDNNMEETVRQIMDEKGRLAIMAVGRGDRLKKGFVLVADRHVLNTLSLPSPPLSLAEKDLPDRRKVVRFLTQVGEYMMTLAANPEGWAPVNPYPNARIPGIRQPKFSVHRIQILKRLPGPVIVTTNRTRPFELIEPAAADTVSTEAGAPSIRGIWEYMLRVDTRIDTLLTLLTTKHFNFFWTVSPAGVFTTDDSTRVPIPNASHFTTWSQRITERLTGSPVRWFVGVSMPDKAEASYGSALGAPGNPAGTPSIFDLSFWEDRIIGPARKIARFSRTSSSLKGIINDWDTHAGREAGGPATTDVYGDVIFRQYVSYAANHGFYKGDEFKVFKKLDRDERYEWLLKAGRLEDYFRMLEDRAALLGRLYRESVDTINPALQHGMFMRSPHLTWFHLGFWRGLNEGTDKKPYLLLTYEGAPPWFARFVRAHGLTVRVVPMVLLGLVNPVAYHPVLQAAIDRGGYCLERGIWLVSDPENKQDLSAPQRQNVTPARVLDALDQLQETEGR